MPNRLRRVLAIIGVAVGLTFAASAVTTGAVAPVAAPIVAPAKADAAITSGFCWKSGGLYFAQVFENGNPIYGNSVWFYRTNGSFISKHGFGWIVSSGTGPAKWDYAIDDTGSIFYFNCPA